MRLTLTIFALVIVVACAGGDSAPSAPAGDPLAGVTAANDTIAITVNPANVGPVIPPNFIGLSMETSSILQPMFKRTSMVNVLKALGTGVLRVGGGSSGGTDRTWWTPGVRVPRADSEQVLTGADFDQLYNVVAGANWTAIVGVNFAAALPDTFAAEAAFIQQHLGSRLAAIEIGNEPDLIPSGRPGYTFATYARDLDAYLAAFQQRAPGVPIAAPATSYDTAWFRQTIAHAPSRFAIGTQHLYSLDQSGTPPSNIRYPTVANVLSDSLRKADLAFARAVVASGQAYGVPARFGEFNTANLGGKLGLSDAFASSLWALDHTFSAAEAGLAGVNYHTGFTGGGYSLFRSELDGTLTARPVLYGILAFQDAAKGQILNVTGTSRRPWNLGAHASVTAADGTVRLALVNKDTASLSVRIVVPNATTVTVRRLTAGVSTAPLTDTGSVTYAGAVVTTSGTFAPAQSESITPVSNTFVVYMPFASAAVIVVTTK